MGGGLAISLTMHLHNEEKKKREKKKKILDMKGAESDVVSAETATELVSRMQNASEVTVNGAGHLVTTDNPIGFIESIDPFLKSRL